MADSESKQSNLQTIATLLQDIGYRAQVDPEHNVIRSAASGMKIAIYLRNGSLGMHCILAGEDSHVQLRHVNEFNAAYRFAKMYVDDDGDIFLQYDFLFDVRKDDAAESLNHEYFPAIYRRYERCDPCSGQRNRNRSGRRRTGIHNRNIGPPI